MPRRTLLATLLIALLAPPLNAHPGSSIFVDEQGTITFTDTGRGVWQVDATSKQKLLSDSAMHWLARDASGAFAVAPDQFGEFFGRITPRGERPAFVSCSDFPATIGPDGNLYFPYMHGLTIKRRAPSGDQSVVASPADFGYDDEHALGVNGIVAGPDGVLYVVMLDDRVQSRASAEHWLYAIDPSARSTASSQAQPKPRVRLIKKNFIPPDELISADQRHHESIPQYCRGIAVDEAQSVYIACTGNRCVVKVSPAGESTVVLRSEKPWSPTGVAVQGGDVYVLEYDDETPTKGRNWPPRVRKLAADGELSTIVTITRE